MLEVRELEVRFGGLAALDGVSFDIHAGQIVGLIGPNGAGKTSLFNCISGLYHASAGALTFDKHDLLRTPPHHIIRLGIARTFQNVALFPRMTVLDNVLVGEHAAMRGADAVSSALRLGRARRAEQQAVGRARAALEVVDLGSVASAPVASLPFATQKRVELARALVSRPRLLLLDEPAGGLNHTEVGELARLIRRVHAEYELTVLLVEHHMGLVMGICDRVVVLSFGRKIAEGPPGTIQNHPAVIEAYLGTPAAA